MKAFMFLFRFAIVLLCVIFMEGIFTFGRAFSAESYEYPIVWIIQGCLLVVAIRVAILDKVTKALWT